MSRSKETKQWLQAHVRDPYVKQAQQEGQRSRAAYKLKEIQEKYTLIKPGMMVLDLGAAPGSWSVLLANWVKPKGAVFALDLLPIAPISGVECIQGDIQDPEIFAELLSKMQGKKADVIVSDMAPDLTGLSIRDAERAAALWEMVLEIADDHLAPEGSMCIKVFHGAQFERFLAKIRGKYVKVQVFKPKASRTQSSEVYLIARQQRQRGMN